MVLNDAALAASCLPYCPRVAPHYRRLPARPACRCGLCGDTVAKSAGRPRISNRRDLRTEKDDLPSNLKLNVAAVRAPKV